MEKKSKMDKKKGELILEETASNYKFFRYLLIGCFIFCFPFLFAMILGLFIKNGIEVFQKMELASVLLLFLVIMFFLLNSILFIFLRSRVFISSIPPQYLTAPS